LKITVLNTKTSSAAGGLRPWPPPGALPPGPPLGLRPQTPIIGSCSRARHVCVFDPHFSFPSAVAVCKSLSTTTFHVFLSYLFVWLPQLLKWHSFHPVILILSQTMSICHRNLFLWTTFTTSSIPSRCLNSTQDSDKAHIKTQEKWQTENRRKNTATYKWNILTQNHTISTLALHKTTRCLILLLSQCFHRCMNLKHCMHYSVKSNKSCITLGLRLNPPPVQKLNANSFSLFNSHVSLPRNMQLRTQSS